ncbi:diaminobutyrate acetyltransferase [Bacillus sp. H-16]|uniref:diaminobutyrate acetyltransferase n=1 Tax=Alteribacter salitolerans TaxID=2912333 RepID=UPI00196254E2|nr:diaminobutyrate acetyltransferase [Alteribacter salitolerans]MBM7094877.1 diaminobutyrate acetyltransferase [Alteribacter salitolerans]
MSTNSTVRDVTFSKPTVNDGAAMWKLVNSTSLDQNSSYKYLMMCEFFGETCVAAKEQDRLVGFITAFIPPKQEDTIFIWQVGVDPSQRGKGVASKMMNELLSREACRNVRFLEATVTPSNGASEALFRGLARDFSTSCVVSTCFPAELFPEDDHESELTFRVGPMTEKRNGGI